MRRILFFLIAGLLLSSCTHRIVRTGYHVKKSDHITCDVPIKKDIVISDTLATKIGEIKLGESGFSVVCSEEHAINILKGEACAIKADLIVITEETRPDLWSSCYRCRANFYKFIRTENKGIVENDEKYEIQNLKSRVSNDRMRNTAIGIGAFLVGFLFAIM